MSLDWLVQSNILLVEKAMTLPAVLEFLILLSTTDACGSLLMQSIIVMN